MVTNVLKKAGATVWTQAMMYRAVVQAVLLYGSDIWVVMGAMLKVIEGFNHQMA